MKKSTVKVTIIIAVLLVVVVGYYAYLSGKSRNAANEAKMTQT